MMSLRVYLYIALLSLCSLLKAQKKMDAVNYSLAEKEYHNGSYAEAVLHSSRIPPKSTLYCNAQRIISDCYKQMGDYDHAIRSTSAALKKNRNQSLLLLHIDNLICGERYHDAALLVAQLKSSGEEVNLLSSRCDSAIKWLRSTSIALQNNIANSRFSDISPIEDEEGILFSSNREGVFIKRKSHTDALPFYNLLQWNRGKCSYLSENINTNEHDFSPAFNKSFDTLYFTRRTVIKVNGHSKAYFKLYCSEKKRGSWQVPKRFMLNDSSYSFAYPFLDEENGIFYFASDMPGGYGGWDLYLCLREDSLWGDPVNLGPEINTSGNEIYPRFYRNVLFFSSDAHFGLGNYDIFKTSFSNNRWQTPVNLKIPVNSGADDVALSISRDGKKAWMVSNRVGGKGQEDIYDIVQPEDLFDK